MSGMEASLPVSELTQQQEHPMDTADDSNESSLEDEADECLDLIRFQSIRDSNQLEVAITFGWKDLPRTIQLSTLLEPDDLAPLFAGAQWAGTRVWHAAIRAIEYLSLHQSEKTIRSSSLLELGCGLGVPGMIYHLLGGSVILTDQESIMSQLNKNVQENFPDSIITPEKGVQFGSVGSTIQTLPLTWSREGVKQLLVDTDLEEQGVDICLNCDCVYEPLYGESWKALVEVMDEMLRVNPKCLMLTSCERRNADGIPNFLEAMQQSSHVSQVDLVHFDSVNNIELYITRGHTVS